MNAKKRFEWKKKLFDQSQFTIRSHIEIIVHLVAYIPMMKSKKTFEPSFYCFRSNSKLLFIEHTWKKPTQSRFIAIKLNWIELILMGILSIEWKKKKMTVKVHCLGISQAGINFDTRLLFLLLEMCYFEIIINTILFKFPNAAEMNSKTQKEDAISFWKLFFNCTFELLLNALIFHADRCSSNHQLFLVFHKYYIRWKLRLEFKRAPILVPHWDSKR